MKERGRRRKAIEPLPPDRWLEPGTRTFAVLQPELNWRYITRTMSEKEVRQRADRVLRGLARCVCRKHRRHDRETIKDLAQDLKIRVAEINAASKFDPTKGTPLDYLGGIADVLAMEKFVRRQPPRPVSLQSVPEPVVTHRPAAKANHMDVKLRRALRSLTPGEQRAIQHHFGRFKHMPPPARRPRRPNNPALLEHAVNQVRAHMARQ